MKKIYIAMLALLCVSCEKLDFPSSSAGGEDTPAEVAAAKKFTFTIKGDFLNPEFRDGTETRANAYMTADGSEMTDLWVVDYKDGVIKQELHQTNTDEDWGSPSMSLTLGTHHVYFLASRGSGPSYNSGKVIWTRPLDTFYLDYEVTVVKTSNGNRAVTLNRCATKLMLYMDDAIPSGTTTLTLTPSVWYTGWDMINGEPIKQEFSRTFDIPATWIGRSGASFTLWSMSTADEWLTNIDVESHTSTGTNASITIPDAPFMGNRATVYHGKLYSDSPTTSSVKLTTEWLNDYEGVY